jgi:electron transfer flavoprotein alpha subunit
VPEKVKLLAERCDGCGGCVPACPFMAIEVTGGQAVIYESCLECGVCLSACPRGAIWMAGSEETAGGSGGRALWVYALTPRAARAPLVVARLLADERGTRVSAVTTDPGIDTAPLIAGGADEVIIIEGDAPDHLRLAAGLAEENPVAVLALSRPEEHRVLAQAAALLGLPFAAGADELEAIGERLALTRPLYGGRFRARLRLAEGLTVAVTLDRHVFRAERSDPRRSGQVRRIRPAIAARQAAGWLAGETVAKPVQVSLTAARIILGGGIELGSRENFTRLFTLAEKLTAIGGPVAVGASKEAVEAGWAGRESLLDGTLVKAHPALYMAFGIEGDPSHNAAVAMARVLVAVTANPAAQITQVADFVLPFPPNEVIAKLLAMPL